MTQCVAMAEVASTEQSVLHLHKAGQGYIGQLEVHEGLAKHEWLQAPQRVLIMDNSGSMGQWSKRMLNEIFPQMLDCMGCHPSEKVLVILFSCRASHHHMTIGDLPGFVPGPQGSTQMSGVFSELQTELDAANPRVQLLALSDGGVSDQLKAAEAAASAATLLKASFQIEARAVRLFTSGNGQPDTRALASVLQLNTDTAANLVDVNMDIPPSEMAELMSGMFEGAFGASFVLESSAPVLQMQPWGEAKNCINLRLGLNAFWVESLPEGMTLSGRPVSMVHAAALNQGTMGVILKDRLDFFVSQLKVLKVIDTDNSKQQIARIVNYFENLEASLQPMEDEDLTPLLEGGLKSRTVFLRKTLQRRMRSITTLMEGIANDDRVRALNQAQQAEYLRQMTTSKNSRALAKRAEASGMDFEGTLRKEILHMKDHLDELQGIDARKHAVSFYSQATTMDGIKEVCALSEDRELFEGLLAVDILRLFNVVGVPAVSPIADFPDPMTYRLDKLLPGSFISVADLSTCELLGGKLEAPGTQITITNAVPIFDDPKIQRFLQKYAPSALEYLCSIGMRRVLAEIPQTFSYTVGAAVWRFVQHLDTDKSELNIMLFQRMVPSYHESLQGRFDYLMPILETDQDPKTSYFLSHNGITNMISPIWRLVADGNVQYMPRLLRALYTFESFQAMRRLCRLQDAKFYIEQLDRLLGVDFAARATPLPDMFSRPEPEFSKDIVVDQDLFRDLCKALNYAKYATLIADFFDAIRKEDPVAQMRKIPPVSDETIVKALDLDYPLVEFLLYNIVEGHLYQSKQSRVDTDMAHSLRPDLGNRQAGKQMVERYIMDRYRQHYEHKLKELEGEENKVLSDELIDTLTKTESMRSFCSFLCDGVTRGVINFKIANFNSQGCTEMHEALMDSRRHVAKRAQKLQVFYTGENAEGEAVWNGGNMLRASTHPLQELLISLGEETIWKAIQEKYSTKIAHVYRGGKCGCNRHGHSNDLPSFFAFGHDALVSYICSMTSGAWAEYQAQHPTCCGVPEFIGNAEHVDKVAERLAAKKAKREELRMDAQKLNALIGAKKASQLKRRSEKAKLKAPQR